MFPSKTLTTGALLGEFAWFLPMQFTNLKISKSEHHAIERASSKRRKYLEGKKCTFLYEWV